MPDKLDLQSFPLHSKSNSSSIVPKILSTLFCGRLEYIAPTIAVQTYLVAQFQTFRFDETFGDSFKKGNLLFAGTEENSA
jgi:hypothetical protein